MYSTKEFLEQFVCKSGETVEQLNSREWQVQRLTTRTYRSKANILAAEQYDAHPHQSIIALKLTPRAKRTSLPVSPSMLEEALALGWIIQEVRFKKDGRTPASTVYRMGPGLYAYDQHMKEEKEKVMQHLQKTLGDELDQAETILPHEFERQVRHFINEEDTSWNKVRVEKFYHFLIAYLQLKRKQTRMEFKEIGATYYREIGGSKAFDTYKDVFIERLEKWVNAPIHELGIISQGSIVPVYFAGSVTGKYSRYDIGTVHGTTDIAITQESFQTNAHMLWLVENRAVLTRMAREEDFLRDTHSLVLGVDGQVRGAHRKMIQQLCSAPTIRQVMIWVDYDQAGQVIARDLVQLVKDVPYRIVGNEGNVFSSYETYKNWATTITDAEQEMTLGSVSEWKKWISK